MPESLKDGEATEHVPNNDDTAKQVIGVHDHRTRVRGALETGREFDYAPYENFQRSFPLEEGKTVEVRAFPESESLRIRFEIKIPDNPAFRCIPVNIMDAGKVLEAFQTLDENRVGPMLLAGIAQKKSLKEMLNINAL